MKFNKILLSCLLGVVVAGASSCSNYDANENPDYALNGESVGIYLSGHVLNEAGAPLEGIEVGIVNQANTTKTTSAGAFWIEERYVQLYGDNENLYLYLNVKDPADVYETKRITIDNLIVVNNHVDKRDIEVALKKK